MPHLDPDLLALLALGEDVATPAELDHLGGCTGCRLERDRLARAVDAARIPVVTGPLVTPDERVWSGIQDELGLTARARGSRRWPAALVAAAVVLGLVGTGTALLRDRGDTRTVATATLAAFPGWTGDHGTAVLERRSDGGRVVAVSTNLRPGDRTDHEVWLMTPGAERLVRLGTLRGTRGSFAVPTGVDVGRYRLVDISDEPRDGDPAHSGDSIVRGALHRET